MSVVQYKKVGIPKALEEFKDDHYLAPSKSKAQVPDIVIEDLDKDTVPLEEPRPQSNQPKKNKGDLDKVITVEINYIQDCNSKNQLRYQI